MSSPQTIDVDALLKPIAPDSPAGSNIREDRKPGSVYYEMKDARNDARRKERDPDGKAPGLLPEWKKILDLAPKVLATASKDLEITAWLIEALVRKHGFAGLRDGFRLAHGFVEQYWDKLYPPADGEDVGPKVAALAGLNGVDSDGVLIGPIRMVPLTGNSGEGPFSADDYQKASRPPKGDAVAVTLDGINAAAKASGAPFYIALLDDIRSSLTELEALSKALDEKAGQTAPPTSAIRETITSVLDVVQSISKDFMPVAAAAGTSDETSASEAAPNGAGRRMPSPGSLKNREEALDVLLQVAEYFRRTEPHSPICSSLEEVVRRARLPFSELMKELLDPDAYRKVLTGAGIRPPQDPG